MTASPSDARIGLYRFITEFFVDAIASTGEHRTDKEIEADEQFANAITTELLEVLQLQVIGVEEDGSITVSIQPQSRA
jgi:hypothetical protein